MRNYTTKAFSDVWMIEKKMLDPFSIVEEGHRLKGVSVKELNLKPVSYINESLTVGESIDMFLNAKNYLEAVPIVNNNKIVSCLFLDRTMEFLVNKKLTREDNVKHIWSKDITALNYDEVDCAVVERMLTRRKVVFLEKIVNGKL